MVRRGTVGELFEAGELDASGMGPPPKGSSRMAESLARMARVLGQSSSRELPAAGDQGLEASIRNEPIGRTRSPCS